MNLNGVRNKDILDGCTLLLDQVTVPVVPLKVVVPFREKVFLLCVFERHATQNEDTAGSQSVGNTAHQSKPELRFNELKGIVETTTPAS